MGLLLGHHRAVEGKENLAYAYMYACSHDFLPLIAFWQERDAISQALIANLWQQIVALQIDDDEDDAEDKEQEGGKDADDDAADE